MLWWRCPQKVFMATGPFREILRNLEPVIASATLFAVACIRQWRKRKELFS
jgi:hypothetical protein